MAITLTSEELYIGIIVVLIGIQLYQQRLINKLQKECLSIWNQVAILVSSISLEILDLQKNLDKKKDKE